MKNQTGKQFPQIIAVEFDSTCFQHLKVPFSHPESSRGCRRWQLWQEGDRLQRLPDASAAPAGPPQASHVRTLSWPLKLKSSECWPLTHRDTWICASSKFHCAPAGTWREPWISTWRVTTHSSTSIMGSPVKTSRRSAGCGTHTGSLTESKQTDGTFWPPKLFFFLTLCLA